MEELLKEMKKHICNTCDDEFHCEGVCKIDYYCSEILKKYNEDVHSSDNFDDDCK